MKKYYKDYVKELSEKADKIFNGDDIKDAEKLIYTLNPESGKEYLDEYIEKRIKVYYDDPSWQPLLSFPKLKETTQDFQ